MAHPFYGSVQWQKVRAQVKARWKRLGLGCAMCRFPLDWVTPGAIHVDHVKPRATHPELALEIRNLQVLCHSCHNGTKQAQERRAGQSAIGEDGWPI